MLLKLTNIIWIDITTIAIPVTYNEPTSFIQRMMEFFQYWPLLVKVLLLSFLLNNHGDIIILFPVIGRCCWVADVRG